MKARLRRTWMLVVAFSMFLALMPAPATAVPVLTPKPPYVGLTVPGTVIGIVSVGETVGGVEFAGIPDGIGIVSGQETDTVDVYVSHEESTIPFRGEADFQDASVTKWTLDTATGGVLSAEVSIPSSDGFLRFCSSAIAGPAEGFDQPVFFTGEETSNLALPPAGAPFGPDPALDPLRQGGYAVVLNTVTGEYTQVPGMGRLNHENTVALPGYNKIVALTTDDTFTATTSQLYMYQANNPSHVFEDKGSLWAFRVTRTDDGPVNPNDPFNDANDYLDIQPGDDWQGEFIRVPKPIARGVTGEAPQDALENWSNEHNVFQFVRLEDVAVDKNDERVVYIADTGASRVVPNPATGRMWRPSGAVGLADNGRIFRFVMNDNNPRKVDSFSVFADGDGAAPVGFTSPDNIDTSVNSLMVQEDTSNASIWRYDFVAGSWGVVATVNDTGGESSGIVDASEWFGPGSWLLDVQAHSTDIKTQVINPDLTLKQEDGQLMLMTIPGS